MAEGKPRARGRKSAKKRDSIIRAAIEIINAKSFALATMSDIAASLDLRDATLYYYFPNKQALVYECHVRSLERFERLIRESDAFEGDGIAKIRHFVAALVEDSYVNGPQLYFGDYSYLEPMQRETIATWAERLRAMLEGVIIRGIDDGSIVACETTLVVQLLLGMLIWLAKWAPDVKGLTAARLMAAIEAFGFHGLESRV
ncbi:TetR/AcrR family transcriptional regulator [Sphingomonas sp. AAP5]|nr:TetR/AcrR family transcriptional regulator [Sphingomonas sp. AAP5]